MTLVLPEPALLEMTFHLVSLPTPLIVQVLRFSTAAEALAVLLTETSSTGEGLFTLYTMFTDYWRVLTVCFSTQAPLPFQVIGLQRRAWSPDLSLDRHPFTVDRAFIVQLPEDTDRDHDEDLHFTNLR